MPSAGPGSCRRLRTLVAQVATPSSTAVRSFAGSELDPVSGLSAGMTITDIKPWVPTARPTLFFLPVNGSVLSTSSTSHPLANL